MLNNLIVIDILLMSIAEELNLSDESCLNLSEEVLKVIHKYINDEFIMNDII